MSIGYHRGLGLISSHSPLRTGFGLFRSTVQRWGMATTAACKCGAEEQTADHIITSCPIFYHLTRDLVWNQ